MNNIKLIIAAISLAGLAFSCSDREPEAFAYGNFETEDVFISSETQGRILEMKVEEGDRIRKGDVIALIDTSQLHLKKLQLIASRKAVATRLTQIERQKEVNNVNIENIEREIKRFAILFLEKAATKKQVDDLEGQLNMLKAQEKSLDSQKSSIYAEMATIDTQVLQIEDQVERSVIKAPFDCTVMEKYARMGELAPAGRKIVRVSDISSLNLRVFVQGDQLSSIKTGDRVPVSYDGPEGLQKTTGTVSWISSEAEFTPRIIQTRDDRVSLVYAVKLRVENDGSIKKGMPGEINIEE